MPWSSFLCGDRWNFGTDKERNSARMLLSPLSFRPRGSLSLFHKHSSPSNSSRVPISLRASYLVISIRVGAFLSLPRLHSSRSLGWTRSSRSKRERERERDESPRFGLVIDTSCSLNFYSSRRVSGGILTSSLESNIPSRKRISTM